VIANQIFPTQSAIMESDNFDISGPWRYRQPLNEEYRMSSAREADKVTRGEVAGLREWVRPSVRDLPAGVAEDDSGPNQDAIINPS
jgi:hypothetical protein